MGTPARHKPVKLVVSLISGDAGRLETAEKMLKRVFGPVEEIERTFSFDWTDYYFPEFGRPLKRKMICFRTLIGVEKMAWVKLAANRLEGKLRCGKNRTVNIDPGYVTDAKLVLLTTKDYIHRVHVGRGIFAEGTLYFKEGSFHPWPWTYRDYASPEMVEYFNAVREMYLGDIKKTRP